MLDLVYSQVFWVLEFIHQLLDSHKPFLITTTLGIHSVFGFSSRISLMSISLVLIGNQIPLSRLAKFFLASKIMTNTKMDHLFRLMS